MDRTNSQQQQQQQQSKVAPQTVAAAAAPPAPPRRRHPTITDVYHALLQPQRLTALAACDKHILSYNAHSFWVVFCWQGRNHGMIILPLAALLLWDLLWGLLLLTLDDPLGMREAIQQEGGMPNLIPPILTPVSFLLVFRLGRAAVRYWEARAAMGKMVEVCRTLASTALVGCGGGGGGSSGEPLYSSTSAMIPTMSEVTTHQLQQEQEILAQDFCRWIATFPMAVKNFLRPWEAPECDRTQEVGKVLSGKERFDFVNTKGDSLYAPILVLNRLRRLSLQASISLGESLSSSSSQARVCKDLGAVLFRQLNEQIDTLTGAWGAMERINTTPLPFVYVVHLRTFLLLYLFLWHMQAMASSSDSSHGWITILPLQLASWGLLGIEAAAVCCERPFDQNSNHLALGKACIVVSRNLAQTIENVGWMQQSSPS